MTYEEFENLNLCQRDCIVVTRDLGINSRGRRELGEEAFILLDANKNTILVEQRLGVNIAEIKLKDIRKIRKVEELLIGDDV